MKFKNFFKKNNNVLLASYPRSGNTWIRILMASLYFDNPPINSLIDLQKYIPDEHFKGVSADQELKVNKDFKIIKTHALNKREQFRKAIYIYRNPVEVAWSYYNFLKDTKKLENTEIAAFVENFLNGSIPFGSWEENVKSWVKHENKIIISYEDFVANTLSSVLQINTFLGLSINDSKIKAAIDRVTPSVVKKITDDEIFYGANKPAFVNTPLNNLSEKKEDFYVKFASQIRDGIKIYDFKNKKLLI